MIYVYRRKNSDGGKLLAERLGGKFTKRIPRIGREDFVVCWGESLEGERVLNGEAPLRSKLTDIRLLQEAGIRTVEFSLAPQEGWLGRSKHHSGGNDLLRPPRRPDYYVKKEDIKKEFRVHSFAEKSIRAGIKIHREGFDNPHEWIRSWDAGWRISYNGSSVKQKHRDISHKTVQALGLTFAAVDLGELRDGTLVVLELNRAPGIEGGTIEAYANAIKTWTLASR